MAKTILVVDDSEVNRVVADAKLKEAGYSVVLAKDGFGAVELLHLEESKSPILIDAVLLDIMMPGMDGMELLRRIRKRWTKIELPVIMATAKSQSEDILHALGEGANDYVTKPLDLPVLLARLSTHLELKESHESLKRAQDLLMTAARSESTGMLAAGVAHEIRNPLGQIQMGMTGLESLAEKLSAEDRELGAMVMETMRSAVRKADGIIVKLMRASESQQLELVEADIHEIIRSSIDKFEELFEQAGVKVGTDFEDGIPLTLLAPLEFGQVLEEILANALHSVATFEDARREIDIKTGSATLSGKDSKIAGRSGNKMRAGDKVVVVSVTDSGPGMAPNELASAFDAFFTSRATGSGTGLGLTVARKIVEMHGGMIQLENADGGVPGLVVKIFLKSEGTFRTSV